MHVEIPPLIRDTARHLGAGVPYALKVLAGRLAEEPDLGHPSGLPGILTVMVDGDLFEDCPALAVGYIREPDRIEIRYVSRAPSAEPAGGAAESATGPTKGSADGGPVEAPPYDTVTAAIIVRQVADAWHRVTVWLRSHAPASYAALHEGAGPAALAALEERLGMAIPLELRALWSLTAGDGGAGGGGCLPGNRVLMDLDSVAAAYRLKTRSRARGESWRPTWIPFVALGPADTTSGLYLDASTGRLGSWSRFGDSPAAESDTLVTYLEETADMLEAPALATRDRPGLIGGALVWLGGVDPAREEHWRPWTG